MCPRHTGQPIGTSCAYSYLCFLSQRLPLPPNRAWAIAAAHLNDDEELVKRVKADFQHADISAKLKALPVIVSKAQKGGRHVTGEDVEEARAQGATDAEIHDTVLIAATFCMYNRYVDGLTTCRGRVVPSAGQEDGARGLRRGQ